MLDALRSLLEHSPMLALFAAIGIGYALGRISIAGFALDIGAVLFAGLAIGAIAPGSAPPALVSSIGLVMFLYGIGIQYGRQFFAGLAGAGLLWNGLGAVAVFVALGVSVAGGAAFGVLPAHAVGMFAGALTSTPALQAAIDAAGSRAPAIGYSVAYPIGIIIPILCIFSFSKLVKPRLPSAPAPPATTEILIAGNRQNATVAEVTAELPPGVHIVAIRHGRQNRLPDPMIRLDAGDGLLLFGDPSALEQAREQIGPSPFPSETLATDRSTLDIARFYVSRAALAGVTIEQMTFPDDVDAKIVEIRRGDASLLAEPSLALEYGDRVSVIASPRAMPALRRHFGDSIKSTTEVSYVSVGLGMSFGILLGLVTVPLPGLGGFSLGLAGGPLVVALVLGRLGRTGPFVWHMPLPANLTLRTFGLTLFIAAVGLGSGAPFVETLAGEGSHLLFIGAAIVLSAMLIGLFVGQWVLRMATDDLFGVIAGITGNPAILTYANKVQPSDRVDSAYAMLFPTITILKVLCAQVVLGLLR